MWSSLTALPIRWCSKVAPLYNDPVSKQNVSPPIPNTLAILERRQSTKKRHQHHHCLIKRHQQSSLTIPLHNPTQQHGSQRTTTCSNLCVNHCWHLQEELRQDSSAVFVGQQSATSCGGHFDPVSDFFVVTSIVIEDDDNVVGLSRWTKCLRANSVVAEAACRFLLGVLLVLHAVFMTGVRRFLARFSGRRRSSSCIQRLLRHHKSSWRIIALIVVYTSLFNIVDGCSSRNTPKPRPPPTPATAAATTARPNITFLTYECPPAYAAWYCLNGATCFTVKIGDSLLYNCECSEGYMGPRCEYKDLDGSYLPSQRRILLETASIAGGATIAVLLVVVLGLVAYVHYYRRQRKEEPPTPPPQLTAAQSTLTTTTDTVDGVTRTVTTTCGNTQVPRRLPTFGTRWKTQNQQSQTQQAVAMTRVDLQQVTTLLGDCEHVQTQPAHAQPREC